MKRAAEKQLIKDDQEGSDDEGEEVSTGFKKADETVLSRRPMRALPRRSLATATSPAQSALNPSVPESTPAAKFAGFGSTVTPSPFSFSPPSVVPPGAPKLAPAIPATTFSPSTTPSFTTSGPSVANSASNATKAFASIVSFSSAPPEPTNADVFETDNSEIEYYKALRGLNVSFLSAVSKAIESDPFVDVAELLERYKSLRISVNTDYNEKPKPTQNLAAPVQLSTPSSSTAPEPAKAPPSFTMPTPPSSFSNFKSSAFSSDTTSSTFSSGGFAPKLDLANSSSLGSPFSFSMSKKAGGAAAAEADAPKSAFGSSSLSSGISGTTSTSSFTFSAGSSLGNSPFGKPAGGAPTSTSTSSSIFGTSFGFGKPPDADSGKETDKAKDSDKPPSVPSFFAFGASAMTSTPEKDKDKAGSTAFSFGSGPTGTLSSAFGGFGGAKAGSIGNPVGFGFGSPPKTPDVGSGSGPVASLPFSLAPKPAALEEKKDKGDSGEGSSLEGTPAPEQPAVPLLATTSVHDLEGEGEEDEETVHEIRCKVFKMSKDKEGNAQWSDVGVGMLRLKKHKTTDVRRMLLRNSGTGKITINFLIYVGMNPGISDKVVSFIGHEQGAAMPYRIRMKTNDQAKELKGALDREIAFVKAKSDP